MCVVIVMFLLIIVICGGMGVDMVMVSQLIMPRDFINGLPR
jgi:hypothetical protein